MSWTRSIGILALCASLLFGLFSWVPNDRGPITVTRPIQLVRAGQRVLVDAPKEALAADFARLTGTGLSWDQADGSWQLEGEIDPLRDIEQATSQQITRADYRLIQIQARSAWEDGTVDEINIETLQPVAWIHDNRVRVGGQTKLPIDALEMGLPDDLTGKVLDILPCPPLREGPGRIVLTTVNHLNRDVVELALRDARGRMETLRPTGTHKFYSVTRGEWLSAAELSQGEHLDGVRGKVTVADIRRVPGTHRVYNLTVQGEHLYRVAHCGVLVHNNRCDVVSEIGLADSGKKIDLNASNRGGRYVYDAAAGRYREMKSGKFVAARNLPWPSNAGFASSTGQTVSPGTVLDRFGSPTGRFLSQPGATISQRGMAAGSEAMAYTRYRVLKPLNAQVGPAAGVSDFGAVGGATQYLPGKSIQWLIDNGFLEVIR